MEIIVIDPGHGGSDPGAIGPQGIRESNIALAVARLVKNEVDAIADKLGKEVKVIQTRNSDVYVSLAARGKLAVLKEADVFLSIHCNSAANTNAHGFEVFTTPGNDRSDPFAQLLFEHFKGRFPTSLGRRDKADDDDDKEASFAVLRGAGDIPAALFELEFIHNEEGEKFLKDPASQVKMAEALAHGIVAFLGWRATAKESKSINDAVNALSVLKTTFDQLDTELNIARESIRRLESYLANEKK